MTGNKKGKKNHLWITLNLNETWKNIDTVLHQVARKPKK